MPIITRVTPHVLLRTRAVVEVFDHGAVLIVNDAIAMGYGLCLRLHVMTSMLERDYFTTAKTL